MGLFDAFTLLLFHFSDTNPTALAETQKISGRACKPESLGPFLFSISCVESTKTICQ
jgi:hypothetical protein